MTDNPTIFNKGDLVLVPSPTGSGRLTHARVDHIDHDPDLGDTDIVVARMGRPDERWTVNVDQVRPHGDSCVDALHGRPEQAS